MMDLLHRVKQHALKHGETLPAANSFQMPLPDAVYHMEESTAVVLDMAILPPDVSLTKADVDTAIILATPTANIYFNIVAIINFVFNIVIFITSGCLLKEKGWLYGSVVGIFQSLFKDLPTANALDLQPDDTIEITLLTPTTRFPFPSMDNTVTET